MEVLSKTLEKASLDGRIILHPKCEDPRVTHLLFADDLLVFSDGSRTSLEGIAAVMLEFKNMSGLEMNPLKSEFFWRARLRISASVCDASRDGLWRLPPARSPEIQQIRTAITVVDSPSPTKGHEIFQWCKANGSFGSTFSSKDTWENLRVPAPMVSWDKVIWFKERILRNSFMAWLALLRRLPTKDKLLRWGMNVTGDCVLCSSAKETYHHLFFECSYSSAIWNAFASQIWTNPPTDLHSAAAWIQSPQHRSSYDAFTLAKLLFQSIIYVIWKEKMCASSLQYLPHRLSSTCLWTDCLGIRCCLFQKGRLPSHPCFNSTFQPIGHLEALSLSVFLLLFSFYVI
ncbi:hypothetical protein Bca101_067024 [Brassica carinata]